MMDIKELQLWCSENFEILEKLLSFEKGKNEVLEKLLSFEWEFHIFGELSNDHTPKYKK